MKKKLIRITTIPLSLEKLLDNQLAFMNNHFEVIAVSSDSNELSKIAAKNNINTFCLNLTRKITPIQDLFCLIKLYFYFKKEKPYIVHSHTPKAGTIGMLAAKLAKVPHRIHTVAGMPLLETKGFKRFLLNQVEKITYQSANHVFPNSFGLKYIIINQNYCDASKVKVIGNGSSNGIDLNYFTESLFDEKTKDDLRNLLGIKPTDFVFIFIGRLVSDKGINELISAFDELTVSHSKLKLILVGKREPELDPLKKETEKIIESNKQIIATGYQADVRIYYAISHALVFPSYREGFPNVVLQAGAMNLPSIVTDINGCNEIIKHQTNGLIIPRKNKEYLLESMRLLVENQSIYNELKSNTRKIIADRYEQHKLWELLLSEYLNFK